MLYVLLDFNKNLSLKIMWLYVNFIILLINSKSIIHLVYLISFFIERLTDYIRSFKISKYVSVSLFSIYHLILIIKIYYFNLFTLIRYFYLGISIFIELLIYCKHVISIYKFHSVIYFLFTC
jgi:hypothetical protein